MIFKGINFQIQMDLCSYLILPCLVHNGLYREAVYQARNIISMHSTSATNIENFMGWSFENGNLETG